MNELIIVATIVAKLEYQDEIIDALKKVVDATRAEEGNISYVLHQNTVNPLEYTILETWKSKDSIDTHNNSVHFQEFKEAINGKIENLKVDIVKKLY